MTNEKASSSRKWWELLAVLLISGVIIWFGMRKPQPGSDVA